MNNQGTIYLIHIEQKVGQPQDNETRQAHGHGPKVKDYQPHAQHRLGHAVDLDHRIDQHRTNQGSRLLAWCNQHGVAWRVVRTWQGTHDLERRLSKHNNNPRLCPICNPEGWTRHGNY